MKSSASLKLENESDLMNLNRLKESEELFRNTFEQVAVGIAHVGTNGNFIRINQKFCDIVGYSRQEMLELAFQDITHADDLAPDLENIQRLLDKKIDTYSMEKRYIRKDKATVWVNLRVSLVRNNNGEPTYFIAVVEDTTERKQTEDKFELLVEQAGDAFFILDYNDAIIDVNRRACNSLGFSRKELLTMNIAEVDIEVARCSIRGKSGILLKRISHSEKRNKMVNYSNSGKDFQIPVDIME